MVDRRSVVIGHGRIIARIGLNQFRIEIFDGPVGKQYLLHSRDIKITEAVGAEGLLVVRRINGRLMPQLLPD
jgi:hypothetical protein